MGAADKDSSGAAGMEIAAQHHQPWGWEGQEPALAPDQTALLDLTIAEVRASPLCTDAVTRGGRSAVWRYLEAAQWREEPTRGKRVSEYFVETLEWRAEGKVDTVLKRAHTFEGEAASGKLFVRGSSLLGRPLIWVHAGRENNGLDPEANVRFLIYTVVSESVGCRSCCSTYPCATTQTAVFVCFLSAPTPEGRFLHASSRLHVMMYQDHEDTAQKCIVALFCKRDFYHLARCSDTAAHEREQVCQL